MSELTRKPTRGANVRRQLNLPLLLGSLLVLAIVIPSGYVWHRYQLRRVSAALLSRATAFEESGQDEQAVHYLYRCLQLAANQPELQRELLLRLAGCYDRSPILSRDKATVIQWHYRAVGAAPDAFDVQLRLAELFLETRQFVMAEQQANALIHADPSSADAQRLRALAKYGQLRRGRPVPTPQVREELQNVQRHHPGDVDVCEALAYVYRKATPPSDQIDPAARADAVMNSLVRHAPEDYRAHLARHNYRLAYQLMPDPRDLDRAQQIAPDNPDVILAAAEQAHRNGDFQQSGALFEQLVLLHPDRFRAHLGWGEALHKQGKLPAAIAAWKSGLSQVTTGRMPLRVRLTEALIEDQQFDAAESQLRDLDLAIRYVTTNDGEIQRDWMMASRDLLQAKLHVARGEFRQAVPLLQKVATTAKADPSHAPEANPAYQAWLLMGQALLQLQQWEEAASSFQRALQIVPHSTTARFWAARAWSSIGHDDQALVLSEQAASRPNAPDDVWLLLAQVHLRDQLRLPPGRRDWTRLEEVLQRATAALPDRWEIALVRANLLVLRDPVTGVPQALEILLAEESAHPESIPLWSNLVFLYERMGLVGEADRALERIKQLQPAAAQTAAWEVALQAARGNFAAAQTILDQLPPAADDSEREWIDRSRLLLAYQQGDLQQIRDVLLSMQAERPQRTEVLAQLADLAVAEGNWVESDRWIKSLKATEGEEGVWWRFFQARRLLGASGDGEFGVSEEVGKLYDEIKRRRPSWPGVAMLRGLIAEAQGVPAEAAESYMAAIRAGFHQPHVYQHLIRVLFQQGRFEEANQWLDQLQQQAPLDTRILDLAWNAAVQGDQAGLAVRLARQNLQRHPDQPSARIWLAQMLLLSGERDEAEALVQEARRQSPRDLASWTGLLSYALRSGNPDEALHCLTVLEQHPALPAAKYHALAGYAYQQLDDREAAKRHYLEALRLSPDDTNLRVRYAAYLQPFDPEQAEAQLRDVLQRAPDHLLARRTLATWLYGRDTPNAQREARELLRDDAAPGRQQTSNQRLEAALLIRRGLESDLDAARVILESLVSEPRHATSEDRLLLGQLYERLGGWAKAEEQFRLLADAQPGTARYVAFYADFLLRRTRLADAQRYLEKLEELAPDNLSILTLRSRLLHAEGRSNQIDDYVEPFAQQQLLTLREAESRQRWMLQIAGLYASVDQPDAAERWYRQLVTEFPEQRQALNEFLLGRNRVSDSLEFAMSEAQQEMNPETATLLIRVLLQATVDEPQRERAERVIEHVLAGDPEEVSFLFALASLRLKQGRKPEAIQLLRRVVSLHPEHVTAWNNLAAVLVDESDQVEEALTCIDRAIAAAGRPVANLLDTKAVILLQQDRNPEAVRLLEQVLALADGDDSRFHFHYAVAQWRIGAAAQARQAWFRAQQLGMRDVYLTEFERELVDELDRVLELPQNGS